MNEWKLLPKWVLSHCWKDKMEYIVESGGSNDEYIAALFNPGTCLLNRNHEGDHQFTSDNNITIKLHKEEE